MKSSRYVLFVLGALSVMPLASADVVGHLLGNYAQLGGQAFDPGRGERLWQQTHRDPDASDKTRSCVSCHTANLKTRGEHVRTGKAIDPLAPSVNRERLTDSTKIEKWFKRNCKWVLGRECTAQEKGDFLVYIQSK